MTVNNVLKNKDNEILNPKIPRYEKLKRKLVWQNTNNLNEFPAQTINFDTGYKYAEILYYNDSYSNNSLFKVAVCQVGKKYLLDSLYQGYIRTRELTFNEGKIVFGEGKFGTTVGTLTTSNTQCIPYQIYCYY